MTEFPSWLPAAAGLAFVAVTAFRSLTLRLRDGVNPYVINHKDPVEGFLGAVFVALVAVLVLYLAAVTARPDLQAPPALPWAAVVLWAFATVWTGWAQLAMRSSWRVGIPSGEAPPLRTDGPFRLSRNPIYVGMLAFLLGLALWSPNIVTVATLAVAYVTIEVQVRLEEAWLAASHGDAYEAYRRRVRRWL